jgi:hypothetical protein
MSTDCARPPSISTVGIGHGRSSPPPSPSPPPPPPPPPSPTLPPLPGTLAAFQRLPLTLSTGNGRRCGHRPGGLRLGGSRCRLADTRLGFPHHRSPRHCRSGLGVCHWRDPRLNATSRRPSVAEPSSHPTGPWLPQPPWPAVRASAYCRANVNFDAGQSAGRTARSPASTRPAPSGLHSWVPTWSSTSWAFVPASSATSGGSSPGHQHAFTTRGPSEECAGHHEDRAAARRSSRRRRGSGAERDDHRISRAWVRHRVPRGRAMPTSSILNVDQAGQTRAAAGIFPVSASAFALFLSGGGHIVVDLLGYFNGASAGAGTTACTPRWTRPVLLDTRGASPLGTGVPLYSGGGLELAVAQGGSIAYNVTSVEGVGGFVRRSPPAHRGRTPPASTRSEAATSPPTSRSLRSPTAGWASSARRRPICSRRAGLVLRPHRQRRRSTRRRTHRPRRL